MRNGFETKFWRNAYESLSPAARLRYGWEMRSAEQWELGLTSLFKLASRAKAALARALHLPVRSTSH